MSHTWEKGEPWNNSTIFEGPVHDMRPCWKLELTEIVDRNVNYSFFELVRQNMRLKLPQWHIRKCALFCNLLTEPKFKVELLYANQNRITKWTNDFLSYPPSPRPSHKDNPRMYSCGDLQYEMSQYTYLMMLTNVKTWHQCYLWGMN